MYRQPSDIFALNILLIALRSNMRDTNMLEGWRYVLLTKTEDFVRLFYAHMDIPGDPKMDPRNMLQIGQI